MLGPLLTSKQPNLMRGPLQGFGKLVCNFIIVQ